MQWVGAIKTEATLGEERYALRHSLSLMVRAATEASDATRVVVHNLSNTGLLIEADMPLSLGDEIEVELPHSGVHRAAIVWASGGFQGCEFETPVSDATVSAARLRSMPTWNSGLEAEPTTISDVRPFLPATRDATDGRLNIRSKLLILGGLTATCWAAIGGAGLLALGLL